MWIKSPNHTRNCIAKLIWLCFEYVIKFLMLIQEMTFVFHKSRQALTRATLKEFTEKINCMAVSFLSNECFRGVLFCWQI